MKKLLSVILSVAFIISALALSACAGGEKLKINVSGAVTTSSGENTPSSSGEGDQTSVEPISPVTYTVNYFANGVLYSTETVEKGGKATMPQAPEREGYTFTDWKKNGLPYDFSLAVNGNLTLVAGFTKPYAGGLKDVLGSFSYENGVYTNTSGLSMSLNFDDEFNYGTVEADVIASKRSDNGLIVCCTANAEKFDQGAGISYYFFFLGIDGTIYLGKSDNGSWYALKVLQAADKIVEGKTYKLKVVVEGTNITCFIDGKAYITYSEINFLHGSGYGIRSGAAGITFTNFRVSNELEY